MQYNLDSDSDDDEDPNSNSHQLENADPSKKSVKRPTALNQLHDIEKLKLQTAELLDPVWKEVRNKSLIHKMLELEDPTITPKVLCWQ